MNPELKLLASWLAGKFSNLEQGNITTHYDHVIVNIIPIWLHKRDGYWLYSEHTLADNLENPYRQQVYHLQELNDETLYENTIYKLKDEEKYKGASAVQLLSLNEADLSILNNCSVVFRRMNKDSYAGSTIGEGCPSNFQGAAYTTSQIVVTKDKMISWDRGFNNSGSQVWGATMGGYIFKKMERYPIRDVD